MPDFVFPKFVFDDVKMTDFGTHNKKQVSEDFIAENFKELGFYTFRPHSDTGIDLIIEGYVCKNCYHPKKFCNCDNKEFIKIKRYIQIKTREIKEETFGYTLSSQDFRVDPRHVFILYSDYTNDLFILPISIYLKNFWNEREGKPNKSGRAHFASPSFRKKNNKINSLKYKDNIWKFNNKSFDYVMNKNGLKLLCNTSIDENINTFQEEQRKIKLMLKNLIHDYSPSRQLKSYTQEKKEEIERKIITSISNRKDLEIARIKELRENLNNDMERNLSFELKESRNKYLKKFKGVKLSGN